MAKKKKRYVYQAEILASSDDEARDLAIKLRDLIPGSESDGLWNVQHEVKERVYEDRVQVPLPDVETGHDE